MSAESTDVPVDEPRDQARVSRAVVYGLAPVAALSATQAIEGAERMALAQAIDGIQDEFGISDTAIGLLPAAMIIVAVLGSVLIGVLADRVRRTRLLSIAVAGWTVGICGTAAAPTYASLFTARLAVGSMEGNGPASISLLGDYYPVRRRARMFALFQVGALIGAMVGLIAGGIAVSIGGWRWAFWIWVPAGIAVAIWVAKTTEPRRGDQDGDLSLVDPDEPAAGGLAETEGLDLPSPTRVGTLDYSTATSREVLRELLNIRTMWLALLALTISQFLLLGIQFWAVEFFKRAHGLSPASAGGFASVFGIGAACGVMAGGFLSDRYLTRGVVNARILVVSISSVLAPVALVPAFLIGELWVTLPFFLVGGALLTMPLAPGEAALNDVVPAALRGRAASVRSIVRSVAALSPLLVGVLSDAIGLRWALSALVPLYAIGGLILLTATRTYPADVAFVAAEAERVRTATPLDVECTPRR